jgi:hypothetical protein
MSNSIQKERIKLEDGRTVDRNKIVFLPIPDKKNPSIVYTSDCAYKIEGGTFKRVVPKIKKRRNKK